MGNLDGQHQTGEKGFAHTCFYECDYLIPLPHVLLTDLDVGCQYLSKKKTSNSVEFPLHAYIHLYSGAQMT